MEDRTGKERMLEGTTRVTGARMAGTLPKGRSFLSLQRDHVIICSSVMV